MSDEKFQDRYRIPSARAKWHIIRNSKEMNRIADYIECNVAKWETDFFY